MTAQAKAQVRQRVGGDPGHFLEAAKQPGPFHLGVERVSPADRPSAASDSHEGEQPSIRHISQELEDEPFALI